MSVDQHVVGPDSASDAPADAPLGTRRPVPAAVRTQRLRQLLWMAVAVVAADWGSKGFAWRQLPGDAVINADTSGALPILPGLLSQPVLGAIVDAAALVLLVLSCLWLAGTRSVGTVAWVGCALVWAGIGSNALDRWVGHLWLAPGSQRGVVDWIGIGAGGHVNLADVIIGVGLLLAISATAGARIPRGARAAVAVGVLLLAPVSMLTARGSSSNASLVPAGQTFDQRIRAMMGVTSKPDGRHLVWRESSPSRGWNLTVDAVNDRGLVLAEWHLPSDSTVHVLQLPKQTHSVYVKLDDTGWVMTLADNLS